MSTVRIEREETIGAYTIKAAVEIPFPGSVADELRALRLLRAAADHPDQPSTEHLGQETLGL